MYNNRKARFKFRTAGTGPGQCEPGLWPCPPLPLFPPQPLSCTAEGTNPSSVHTPDLGQPSEEWAAERSLCRPRKRGPWAEILGSRYPRCGSKGTEGLWVDQVPGFTESCQW